MKTTASHAFALALAGVLVAAAPACKTATTEKAATPAQPAASRNQVAIDPGLQVGTMDGQPITYGDLEKEDKQLGPKVKKLESDFLTSVYEARREALDNFVAKKLLDGEAKKANKTLEEWFKTDFQKTVPKPSEEEAKAFYEEHKAEIPPGTDYAAVKDRIVQVLQGQQGREAMAKLVERLRAEHKVVLALAAPEVPRVEVAATGPARGPASAKVTIVEFSDFECPFCGRELPVVERVLKEYSQDVRLVFRQFPLDFHPHAGKAAEAALCAADGGKFWEMHDKMFGNQKALEVDKLKDYAKQAGLDSVRFDKCLDSGEKKAVVDADQKAGSEAGVNGTPAFFVNGILISGAQEFDKFKDVIDRELKKK